MKAIIYSRPDGGVGIVNTSATHMAKQVALGLTEDQVIADVQAKDVPGNATNVEVVEQSDIPGFDATKGILHHHEYRDALEKTGVGPPVISMPKARTIHSGRIDRAKRALARDLIERETIGENVAAEKATLAAVNVQAQINSAATPNALKAIWPASLPR